MMGLRRPRRVEVEARLRRVIFLGDARGRAVDERVSAHVQKLCPLKLLRFVARAAVHFVYTPHPSCLPQKQNADAYS